MTANRDQRQQERAARDQVDRMRRAVHVTRAIGEADPPDALDLDMREQNMHFRRELVKALATLARVQGAGGGA